MKIVHLARLYAPHLGGVETHVGQLNRLLVQQGHTITVLTEQFDDSLPLTDMIDGVSIQRLPQTAHNHKLTTWAWIWQHRQLLFDADVIQVHDVFWWLLPVLPFIEEKVFTTFHGWETQYPVPWQAKLQRLLFSKLSVATVHVGDWIKEFYWDRPTAVTYGGVETARAPQPKKLHSHLRIVFLGRLSVENEVKKYVILLDQLKKNGFTLEVTWIGDGPLRSLAEKYGTVKGLIKPTAVLQSADVVFASSYLSMLQAQALGKLVVALYSHRLKQRYLETFPGASQMIVAESPSDAADSIKKIVAYPQTFNSMTTGAYEFAKQQTWVKVLAMYESLWKLKHD